MFKKLVNTISVCVLNLLHFSLSLFLEFIKSDFKLDKMEKLNLMTDKEKQIKEKEFKDFLNDYVKNRLDDLVVSTVDEIITYANEKNDLYSSSKINFLTKTSSESIKVDVDKINLQEAKNLSDKIKTDNLNEDKLMLKGIECKAITTLIEKFKEPADQVKHELDKLIKSQSITSQLADKLIMNDDRREQTVKNVLEAMKKECNETEIELNKNKLEDKLKEELEKIKREKELEEKEKRMRLEEKIQEEFTAFKQGKSDRYNKRLQKFNQLKPIQLIKLMESCYENLIAFVNWPHAIFPAKTAKEIVYCIDLIAVILKKFYQKLEQKSRFNFENVYKDSLERFIVKIRIVNNALMGNNFVDPDLRMNVVEWTEYQEKSWRGVVISLECSKQINKFCILKESNTDRKLRMLPKRKLIIGRKRN